MKALSPNLPTSVVIVIAELLVLLQEPMPVGKVRAR